MAEPTVAQLFDLTGKTALVTGATGYLGSALARALAEAGATVVISSRSEARAREAAAALPNQAAGHRGIELDHMDHDSLPKNFERAGTVDILVNNGHEGLGSDWTTVTA